MKKLISIAATGLLATLAGGSLLAVPAAAVVGVPATCATLQATLTAATAGEVIMLTEANCSAAYTIPDGINITLEGQVQADGFDGGGTVQSLKGNNNGDTVITNLTFKNGHSSSSSGAGLLLTNAGSATVSNSIFTNNNVVSPGGFSGGAVEIDGSGTGTVTVTGNVFGGAGKGNSAPYNGGALAVLAPKEVISGNQFIDNSITVDTSFGGGGGALIYSNTAATDAIVFTNNVLIGNTTAGSGGAGAFLPSSGGVTVTGNTFRGNVINFTRQTSSDEKGGGLDIYVDPSFSNRTVTQANNIFDSNVIHGGFTQVGAVIPHSSTPADYGGAGEFVVAGTVTSTDDTYTGNHVDSAGPNSTDTPIGGAFALQGTNTGNTQTPDVHKTTFIGRNLVAVNNSVGNAGEGGGIYGGFTSGCRLPPCTAEIDLFDSTVTNNTVGAGGTGTELAGDTTDVARVINSIVTGPVAAQTDVQGFGTIAINHSDACVAGAAATGAGNICKDPKLLNVAGNDVHQTASSPTIDAGDTSQVPADLPKDYKGGGRVLGARVDMGADEFVPPAVPTPAPTLPKAGQPVSSPASALWIALLGLGLAGLAAVSLERRRARLR